MFGSNILDVAIGLISLFLLLSLIASAANELLEGFMRKRARDLERGILALAGGSDPTAFVAFLYNHGLINSLYRGDYKTTPKKLLPSYIPARNFALAVLDLARNPPTGMILPENVKTTLRVLEAAAANDAERLQRSVEDWYNSAMDRVSGWYKRRTQMITFVLGIFLAVGANADCVSYGKRLASDTSLRQSAVAFAEATAKNHPATDDNGVSIARIKEEMVSLNGLGLPVGWEGVEWNDPRVDLQRIIGWLLTATAVSLGAPFWFDMLNKIMVIRSTVKPQEKSREEKPKDPAGTK